MTNGLTGGADGMCVDTPYWFYLHYCIGNSLYVYVVLYCCNRLTCYVLYKNLSKLHSTRLHISVLLGIDLSPDPSPPPESTLTLEVTLALTLGVSLALTLAVTLAMTLALTLALTLTVSHQVEGTAAHTVV